MTKKELEIKIKEEIKKENILEVYNSKNTNFKVVGFIQNSSRKFKIILNVRVKIDGCRDKGFRKIGNDMNSVINGLAHKIVSGFEDDKY